MRYEKLVSFEDVREQLDKAVLTGAKVTQYGSARDVLVKISNREGVSEQQLGQIVLNAFFQIDFDLTILAAMLAVVGYSLNDTIVIYDRVKENFRKVRKGTPKEITRICRSHFKV